MPGLFTTAGFEQLLIMTFGADLDFYGRVLRRQFGSLRNQIILADAEQVSRQLSRVADAGALRSLNTSWLLGPVQARHAVHAKIILLAGAESGQLLVGSGNLSLPGYAGAGEAFTAYRWSPEDSAHLAAFTSVKALTDALQQQGALDRVTTGRLQTFWSAYEWWHAPPDSDGPMRLPIGSPLGEQFVAAVGGEHVQELTVLSPFHDPACRALAELRNRLTPDRVRVLVQNGRCSVDPVALAKVLRAGKDVVQAVTAPGDLSSTYLHAKIFLATTATRSICLIGSANCSQVALWRTFPAGNVEAASLLTGDVGAFDHLFADDVLTISPPADPTTLDLALSDDDESVEAAEDAQSLALWDLRLDGHALSGRVTGVREAPSTCSLAVAHRPLSATVETTAEGGGELVITASLTDDERALIDLGRVVAVHVDEDVLYAVPYRVDLLQRQDRRTVDADRLRAAAAMELDDPDLERQLAALEEILVGENAARWTQQKDDTASSPEGGGSIRWEDIDWDAVRRTPRASAYGTLSGLMPTGSSLAEFLSALSSLVRQLAGEETSDASAASEPRDDEDDEFEQETTNPETDEPDDLEDEAEAAQQARTAKRNARLLTNFVKRNLNALESPVFRDGAGPGVVIPNVVILNWVCWWAATKDWEHSPDLFEERYRLWRVIWGDGESSGYLDELEAAVLADVQERLEREEFWPVLAASMADVAAWTQPDESHLLPSLIRAVFGHPMLELSARQVVRAAALTNTRPMTEFALTPARLVKRLLTYGHGSAGSERIGQALGVGPGAMRRTTVTLVGNRRVSQIEVSEPLTSKAVRAGLEAWLGVEELPTHRLKWVGGVASYDPVKAEGWIWEDADDDAAEFGPLTARRPVWQQHLEDLLLSVPLLQPKEAA